MQRTPREEGQGRVSAGLAALRAAAAKDRGAHEAGDFRERLARITERDEVERDGSEAETERGRAQERLRETPGKDRGDGIERDGDVERDGGDRPSIRERLDAVLNKPRERLDLDIKDERERELEKAREIEKARELDRGPTHGL